MARAKSERQEGARLPEVIRKIYKRFEVQSLPYLSLYTSTTHLSIDNGYILAIDIVMLVSYTGIS